MPRLDALATEILLAVVECLVPAEDFASVECYGELHDGAPPPLKSLALCNKRLYAICFPYLFRSLRLVLTSGRVLDYIDALRKFLRTHRQDAAVENVAVVLGPSWNVGKLGIELKKFLWELPGVKSLNLYKDRSHPVFKEKSARWPYTLERIERLRLETIDFDIELKMLLLRQCPARLLVVEDGDFRDAYDDDGAWSLAASRRFPRPPAVVALKPSVMFPNLKTLVYSAIFPTYNRFDLFLKFASKLPELRHFTVTLMGGQDEHLNLPHVWYWPSPDAVRYREIVSAYQILACMVEEMDTLEYLVSRDRRIPYYRDTEPPASFEEIAPGIYQRRGGVGDDAGGDVSL